MNVLTKSLIALTLITGPLLSTPTFAAPPVAAASTIVSHTPAQDALAALSAQPNSPLPVGTRLLSINLAGGLATVDFSRELQTNFTGGDTQGIRTVSAVLRTLGQFPTVDRVQFLVEGKPVDTLGGILSLSAPLPVIRPAGAAPSPPTAWLHRRTPAKAGPRA